MTTLSRAERSVFERRFCSAFPIFVETYIVYPVLIRQATAISINAPVTLYIDFCTPMLSAHHQLFPLAAHISEWLMGPVQGSRDQTQILFPGCAGCVYETLVSMETQIVVEIVFNTSGKNGFAASPSAVIDDELQ
ncbi:hypothetical protein DNTS_018782 [Danionella cerebrum]|uniref:Uncharacterized protein n=1 Tax=Danionella cerebrum TaxID=2873325 RepID=A0A553PYH7_9TELE|nr:hypothetical protein DNTS_018782 [Danionella translucida]